jgi:hypothetical protein
MRVTRDEHSDRRSLTRGGWVWFLKGVTIRSYYLQVEKVGVSSIARTASADDMGTGGVG